MKERERGPDPVVDSDRDRGTTPPEQAPEGGNLVGRPAAGATGEKNPLNEDAALKTGGSFDGIAPSQKVGGGAEEPSRK